MAQATAAVHHRGCGALLHHLPPGVGKDDAPLDPVVVHLEAGYAVGLNPPEVGSKKDVGHNRRVLWRCPHANEHLLHKPPQYRHRDPQHSVHVSSLG